MNQAERESRALTLALSRGDRIASINLAQRRWHAGDVRRTAIVGLWADTRANVEDIHVERAAAS